MIPMAANTKVGLATRVTDMRKGFNGLFALTESVLRLDPFSGHRRHRFGARSETLEQLELTLEEAEIGVASADKAAPASETSQPKQPPKRKPLPDSLPRNEQVLVPGDAFGQCGSALKGVGEDVTEELDQIPGRLAALFEPLADAIGRHLRGDLPGAYPAQVHGHLPGRGAAGVRRPRGMAPRPTAADLRQVRARQ
ncbi:MAG: IS66 family insertion sequence element accessory protein TnpB, partial [Pseudomonadota bacterium]